MAPLRGQLRCLLGLGLGLSAMGADDAESLIQADVQASRQDEIDLYNVYSGGRADLLKQYMKESRKPRNAMAAYDCYSYPEFCKEPFNCEEGKDPFSFSISRDGHANVRTWCDAKPYYDYMTTCLQKKDLVKAAKIQFDWSIKNKGVDEMDASYCFMEGHCTNTAVTANTTLAESEKMCDARYGHNGWARWSPLNEPRAILSGVLGGPFAASKKDGFHDPKLTRAFLKLACAMGNYHCDVMYCKETYCKKDYYIKKYKHLEPKIPGHLLKQHLPPL